MDALVDDVKCEVSSNMVNLNVTPVMTTSPLARGYLKEINLDSGCDASLGNGLQEAATTFGMPGTPKEEVLPLKVTADSGIADFMEPNCNRRGHLVEVSASTRNIGEPVECYQLSGAGKGFCNSVNDFLETQPPKENRVCAVCCEKIKIEETAEIKGCEHAYCVTCILRWATYKPEPWCPQCRIPFSFLYVYRALDGSLSDYLFEESVCLLLRAFWFEPLVVQEPEEQDDYQDDYDDAYEEEPYYASNVRLGNRRWGDSGYVRAGRREARPVSVRQMGEASSSMSKQPKGKEAPVKEAVGRRARRAQKREQLDKMIAKK